MVLKTGTSLSFLHKHCPVCEIPGRNLDIRMNAIPVNSVRLLYNEQTARDVETGDLCLYSCPDCGFVWNASFEPSKVVYSNGYEATQSFSDTYRRFLDQQATAFVSEHDIRQKTVVEIGCGNGEFLAAICEAGNNTGTGYDPAADASRVRKIRKGSYRVQTSLFDNETSLAGVDVIFCRNTLEHIADVKGFITNIRTAIGEEPGIRVIFQLPAWERIVEEGAFWDIYYEHCSYFSAKSLRCLFENSGFSVSGIETVFAGQYLLLIAEAVPGDTANHDQLLQMTSRIKETETFKPTVLLKQQYWQQQTKTREAKRERVVLWGGGSKAVAFLSAIGQFSAIVAAVDVNPNKWGSYLPASGLPVIEPAELADIQPHKFIIMNPVYLDEITRQLKDLGIDANVECLA
jgi:2-polyprenyl-3-methyl-5-hydroxy-6-metoxy-1,4-benzoquinol methylase